MDEPESETFVNFIAAKKTHDAKKAGPKQDDPEIGTGAFNAD